MVDAKTELTRAWLKKAKRDLGSAKKLAEDSEPYFDTAVYIIANKQQKKFLILCC